MKNPRDVTVTSSSVSLKPDALEIENLTGIPYQEVPKTRWVLNFSDDGLELRDQTQKKMNPLVCDFESGIFLERLRSFGRNQPLARATLGNRENLSLLDCTAGLGRDALSIASLFPEKTSSKVTLLERSPIVWALLRDGLKRASQNEKLGPIVDRLELILSEATDFLRNAPEGKYDVIFLDPMFPVKKKMALPSKEMQMFRALLGDDEDFDEVLDLALQKAKERVVVKRPDSAGEGRIKPSHVIGTKLLRFDVYLV